MGSRGGGGCSVSLTDDTLPSFMCCVFRQEWVEIIEPSSREKMYTNPSTGEIVFTPPEGAIV